MVTVDFKTVLDLPMQENDAEAKTIKDYLKALLLEVWQEQEAFSGKRPFGNSGWDYDLYIPLIKHKLIAGQLDEYGYIVDVDEAKGFAIILQCIEHIFGEKNE